MAATWLRYANPADHASPDGPDYFRDAFPYSLPPIVQFEREPVPLDPAPEIWITDTTFRDGRAASPTPSSRSRASSRCCTASAGRGG